MSITPSAALTPHWHSGAATVASGEPTPSTGIIVETYLPDPQSIQFFESAPSPVLTDAPTPLLFIPALPGNSAAAARWFYRDIRCPAGHCPLRMGEQARLASPRTRSPNLEFVTSTDALYLSGSGGKPTSFPRATRCVCHGSLRGYRVWTTYKWDMKRWQMPAMTDCSTFLQCTTNSALTSGNVLLVATQAVHADASVLWKQLIRELDITEDVDEIEAFFEGLHAALVVDGAFRSVVKNLVEHQMLVSFRFQCLFDSCDSSLPEPVQHRRALVGVRALWDVFSLKPDDYPFRLLVGAPFEGPGAMTWYLADTAALPRRACGCCRNPMHPSDRSIQRGDQSTLRRHAYAYAYPQRDQNNYGYGRPRHRCARGAREPVRDTESLRANDGLLVLINLLTDLAAPLCATDAFSLQIARIVGEVVPWLFPPWDLRARAVPDVRDALADACEFVGALTGKAPNPRIHTHSSQTTMVNEHHACPERQDAFTKLVEELRALASFVCDEPQHTSRN